MSLVVSEHHPDPREHCISTKRKKRFRHRTWGVVLLIKMLLPTQNEPIGAKKAGKHVT
jgi:hypothetical protein